MQESLIEIGNKRPLPRLAEVRTETDPDERLVFCTHPMPAEHRRCKRQDFLAITEEKLAKIGRQVMRRTKTPWLAPQIAEEVGRDKNQNKAAKHFEMVIEDGPGLAVCIWE